MFPKCNLKPGQSIAEWYNEEKGIIDRSYGFSIAGLNAARERMQERCSHEWTRYEELFYALGNTRPGIRCDKCGCERDLADEENPKNKTKGIWGILLR